MCTKEYPHLHCRQKCEITTKLSTHARRASGGETRSYSETQLCGGWKLHERSQHAAKTRQCNGRADAVGLKSGLQTYTSASPCGVAITTQYYKRNPSSSFVFALPHWNVCHRKLVVPAIAKRRYDLAKNAKPLQGTSFESSCNTGRWPRDCKTHADSHCRRHESIFWAKKTSKISGLPSPRVGSRSTLGNSRALLFMKGNEMQWNGAGGEG